MFLMGAARGRFLEWPPHRHGIFRPYGYDGSRDSAAQQPTAPPMGKPSFGSPGLPNEWVSPWRRCRAVTPRLL